MFLSALSKTGNRRAAGSLLFAAGVLLFFGYSGSPEQRPAPSQSSAVTSPVSINALMVAMVDHAAHVIWDADKTPPKTDKDWQEVEHHAVQLAAAGSLITLGGTGRLDQGWAQQPGWKKYAKELSDASLVALTEVRHRNVEGVAKAGDRIVNACEGCHKQFKPDVPTEGIYHTH